MVQETMAVDQNRQPFHDIPINFDHTATQNDMALTSGPLATDSETVLVVDDEPLVREVTAFALQDQGYNVLTACNGAEALNVARELAEESIHLLLTDLSMPSMSFQEFLTQFSAIHPKTKVIFMSGCPGGTEEIQEAPESGREFLQKPFCLTDLAQRVRYVLDQ